MSKKLVRSVFAIVIAVAALIFCISFSQAYTAGGASPYQFSLEAYSRETQGSATAGYGDDRLNIIKAPVKEGAELLLYFISFKGVNELIADSSGKFFAGVDGYTDEAGRFMPEKEVPSELFTVWFSVTQTDNYMQLSFFEPCETYIGEYIFFTFQWYDEYGIISGQTSNDIQRADCYCKVTVSTAHVSYEFTLPEVATPAHSIDYELNGGDFVSGYSPQYSYFDEQVILPSGSDINRVGHRFDGWYDNPGFTGEQITEISETETGDKIYFAKWTPETYAVTLFTNGGEAAFAVTEYTYGVGSWLPSVSLDGHSFDGWYVNGDFTGSQQAMITENDVGDLTFYAKLTPITYTIEYILSGGVINEGGIYSYTYGADIILPQNVTRDDYRFLGWYDNPDFFGDAVVSLSATDFGHKVYYANWISDRYSIAYETNGGEISGEYATVYIPGQTVILPETVTKTGYVFKGWYLDENFCGNSITTYKPDGGDLIFYAKWETKVYTVTVRAGAGYVLSSSVKNVEHGGSCKITFELLDGFMGGAVYANGEYWSAGSGTYYDITGDIHFTVDGIRLDGDIFRLNAKDGTYNGNEHTVSAFNDIGITVKYSWYLGGDTSGEPVKVTEGTQSGFAVTDAGTYIITVVISVIGAENLTVTKSTEIVISKAALGKPSASYNGGVITLSASGGTGNGVAGYLCLNGYGMDGNKLTVTGAGTYSFIAVGDGNHYDSEPCTIVIHAVTLVSEGNTVAVFYAEDGSALDITLTAEKKSTADYIYKFSGWYDGGVLFDGYVYDSLTLTARFTEYAKTVTVGGVTITSADGIQSDTAIGLSGEVGEDAIQAFISEASAGKAVYFVNISLDVASGGSYTVTYRLPAELWGRSLAVYHYLEDGTVERVQSYVTGGDIVFITDGFSPFAFFDVTQYAMRGYDGDGNAYFLGSYTIGDYISLSAVAHPASEGYVYIFDGWYSDEGMQTPVSGVTVAGDIILYAKFIKKAVTSVVYYNVTAVDKNGNMYFIGTYAEGSTADLSDYKVTPGEAYVYDGLYNLADERVTQMVIYGDTCLYVKFIYTGGELPGTDPQPVYRLLSGVDGDRVYNLLSYENGTVLSLTLFSLPAYETDGKTYVFEGWYSDAGLSIRIDSVTMDSDKTIYAKFIVQQPADDGIRIIITVSAASAALLFIVLIIVISLKVKPRRVQTVTAGAQVAADPILMRAEENFKYVCGELDSAENYLEANPDREKSRSLSNARGLFKECEYILKGMREKANTVSGAKENHFAEASLDRLFYEINSIISSEIF